jgi:hypothetical protein
MAWICWNEELLQHIKDDSIEPEDTSWLKPVVKDAELECVWEAGATKFVQYNMHFRSHGNRLGRFSETLDYCIDQYGFNDPRSREVGRAAFIQVRALRVVCLSRFEVRVAQS